MRGTQVSLKNSPVSLNSTQVSLSSSPVSLMVSIYVGGSCLASLACLARTFGSHSSHVWLAGSHIGHTQCFLPLSLTLHTLSGCKISIFQNEEALKMAFHPHFERQLSSQL